MPEQPYLPGTEPPHHNVDIERALATWHEKKIAQRRASAETKQAHATIVLHLQHAGLEAYPWTNPDTGKKRNFLIEREPKVKEARMPNARSARRGGNAEIGDAVEKRERRKRREEEKVEVRRVPRAAVESDVDPFGSTRDAMKKPAHAKPKRKKK